MGIFFLSFFILVICIFSLFFSLFSLTKGLSILLVFSENHLQACVLSIVFLFYSFPLFIVPSIYLEFSFTSFLEWRLGSLILGLSQFLILLLLFSHSVWLFATLWMASPTQWTWVWVDSRSWWWTGRPGVQQSMGSQRVGHNWVTRLNWTERTSCEMPGWMKHKLGSRLLGEISITSDTQMMPHLRQKAERK